jgi:hypothetical protein
VQHDETFTTVVWMLMEVLVHEATGSWFKAWNVKRRGGAEGLVGRGILIGRPTCLHFLWQAALEFCLPSTLQLVILPYLEVNVTLVILQDCRSFDN